MSATDQLLDRIAAAEAAQYPLMESLTAELSAALRGSPPHAPALKNILIRLQQILTGVRANRLRLHRELNSLECCRTYLGPASRRPRTVSVCA